MHCNNHLENNLKIKTIICTYKSHFSLTIQEKRKGKYFFILDIFNHPENNLKNKSICTYESYYSPIVQRFPLRIF